MKRVYEEAAKYVRWAVAAIATFLVALPALLATVD
ncbi:hypothetical protein GALL_100770 [mine drainage metagenome]|uniref:Uncharacterized protein n=1 Tax=mine drainage metagenome TaxID=410659 RepID=A0A1J5SIQ0_9ZZZZ